MEQESNPVAPTPVTGEMKGTSLDAVIKTLFSVKEEPIDFDLSGTKGQSSFGMGSSSSATVGMGGGGTEKLPKVGKIKEEPGAAANPGVGTVPQIGSTNSAFLPYKQQSLTILTNLQRGNVKTTNKETGPEALTFHEKAAKATLLDGDIAESTVNIKDPNGYTPLMWAAFHGRLTIVQRLVERGAVLDCYGPDGETALMFAATNGHTPVLVYLLAHGADVDAEDDAGNTALMFAAYGNYVDCVVQLLRSGANMSKPNGIGDTPFEITINKGHCASQYAMEDFLKEEIEMRMMSGGSNSQEGGIGAAAGCSGRINGNNSNNIGKSAEVIVIANNSNCNNKSLVGQLLEGGIGMSRNLESTTAATNNGNTVIVTKGDTSSKHGPS